MDLNFRNSSQAQLPAAVLDLASHKLEPLGGDGELALYRAHPAESSKSSPSMLVVVPLTQPSAAALRRMRHEYPCAMSSMARVRCGAVFQFSLPIDEASSYRANAGGS